MSTPSSTMTNELCGPSNDALSTSTLSGYDASLGHGSRRRAQITPESVQAPACTPATCSYHTRKIYKTIMMDFEAKSTHHERPTAPANIFYCTLPPFELLGMSSAYPLRQNSRGYELDLILASRPLEVPTLQPRRQRGAYSKAPSRSAILLTAAAPPANAAAENGPSANAHSIEQQRRSRG